MEGIFKGLEKVAKLLLEAQQSCNNQRVNVEAVCEDCRKLLVEWEKEVRPKAVETKKQLQVEKPLLVANHISEAPVIKEVALAENLLMKAKKLKEKHQRIFPVEKTSVLSTVTNILQKGSPEHSAKSCFPAKDLKRFQSKKSATVHKFRSKSKSPARKHLLKVHDGYSSSDTNGNVKMHSPLLDSRKKFSSAEPTVILSKRKAEQLQSMYGIILLADREGDVMVSSLGKQEQKKTCITSKVAGLNSSSKEQPDSSVDNATLGNSIPGPSERFKKAFSFNLQARSKVKKLLKSQNRNEYAKRFQTKLFGTMINEKFSPDKLIDEEAEPDKSISNCHIHCQCTMVPNWMWYPPSNLTGFSGMSETLTYSNTTEVYQFYLLSTDIQWYSLLLDIYRIVQEEVLPCLYELNLSDSNFYNILRCIWSILCTEGKSFPILVHNL